MERVWGQCGGYYWDEFGGVTATSSQAEERGFAEGAVNGPGISEFFLRFRRVHIAPSPRRSDL